MYTKMSGDKYFNYYASELKIETPLGPGERIIRVRSGQKINQAMMEEMNLFCDTIVQDEGLILTEVHIDYQYYETDDELAGVPSELNKSQLKNYISGVSIFIYFEKQNEYGITVGTDWDEEHPPTYTKVNGKWDRYE